MKIGSLFILYFLLARIFAQSNYTQYVNPIIGTGGHGHTFPGATLPFAMVQLSPDTRIDGSWDGCSGFHYSDSIIYGFSHTHLSGTGCSDYGDIAFMPSFTKTNLPSLDTYNKGEKFKHKNEIVKAGFYSVKLDNGIKVELTSTTRVGIQQYTFTENGYAWITLNLHHRDQLLEGKINSNDNRTFNGKRKSKAWAEEQLLFFHIEISKDYDEIIEKGNDTSITSLILVYKVKDGEKIWIKTALSSVDEAGANANMKSEMPHWNFEKVKADANVAWNIELNKIKTYGGTKTEKANFYTALYHCMIHPNIMNDADGRYMGRDKQIHKAEGFNYYTVFSLWDTYRALHPLLNIIDKERSHDFIMTFKAQFEQSGRLPMWELWGNETNCMIGFHSVSIILDAYNKNVITFEELKALYPAVKAEAMSNRFGLNKFREKGYLSIEDESESVSKTLEYSYDYSCVAEIAGIINERVDKVYFTKFSNGWRNIYNTQTGFMTPRKNGAWLEPFNPTEVNNHYTEANAWQYSFAVPQCFWSIAESKKVSRIFNTSSKTSGREQADITGLIGQYAHGNEPSHHIPYLFRNIDSTAKYVTKICNELYKTTPDGLCGNEDCGQLSAWYVFSAMGFYPVNPSSNTMYFGKMIFDSVKMKVYEGYKYIYKNETMACKSKLVNNYLKSSSSFFYKDDKFYFDANNQIIIIGNQEKNFAKDIGFQTNVYIPSPIIVAQSEIFKDSLSIKIVSNYNKNSDHKSKIMVKINGGNYMVYHYPFNITKNTTVKTYEILDSTIISNNRFNSFCDTSTGHYYKKPNNYSIKISSTYNKQYTADGDEGLIDGLVGDSDWRKGKWQGYQGQDFEAIVDMQTTKKISQIGVGFLQDTRSWILFPKTVEYYGSIDGINFELIEKSKNTIADSNYTIQRQILEIKAIYKPYRYIKIKASNYGKLPMWHQGTGGDAFIFIDEIEIK